MPDREQRSHIFLNYAATLLLPQAMRTRVNWLLAIMIALACNAGQLRAQSCIGDCDGSGRPTVDELVRGVNILLERASLTLCPTLDTDSNGKVAVNELVRAVADILYGCGVTPPTMAPTSTATVTPISTPTSTNSPIATATATQPVDIPNIAGQWREDQYQLDSSNCIDPINALIASIVDDLPACVYTVTQSGSSVTVTDCDAVAATGTVNAEGMLLVDLPTNNQTTEDGCTLVFDPQFGGDLSTSPTTVHQALGLTFEGTCDLEPCSLVVTSRWTRL
jgi:hypothetical protein